MDTTQRIIGAVLGTTLLGAAAIPASAAPPQDRLTKGDTAFVDVAAATVWVEPNTGRPIDKPSKTNPVDLDQWNANMQNTETRRWLTGKLETQAVLGSEVEVDQVKGKWAKVVVLDQATPRDERGYPGWVPVDQLTENDDFGAMAETKDRAVVTDRKVHLGLRPGDDSGMEVSFNTELPVVAESGDDRRVALPDGSRAWLDEDSIDVYAPGEEPAAPSGEDLVETGERFLGLRYLWAGVSAWGFDCSGFTYTIHRAHGIDIPRDAGDQATVGQDVAEDDLQAGDLLFFAQPGGTGSVHHVGMYIGDGKMIHAPNAEESVSIVDWQVWDENNEFSGAKRMSD